MKKIMSMLMMMLMVLSFVPFAFAQEGDNITIPSGDNETIDVNITEPVDTNVTDVNVSEPVDVNVSEPVDTNVTDVNVSEPVDVNVTDVNVSEPVDVNVTDVNVSVDPTTNETIELTEEEEEEAGITPANGFLWGLERAIERIELSLTFNRAAKAKKGLKHARERLMEVKAMIAAKRLDKAQAAQEAHDATIQEVEDNIEQLGNGDAEEDLEDELELEKAINDHATLVQNIGKIKLKTKGLTEEQQAAVETMLSSLGETTDKIKISIKVKKDKTKIKIKARSQVTEEEIAEIEAKIREEYGEDVEIKIKGKKGKGKNRVEVDIEVEDDDDDDDDEDEDDDDDSRSGRGRGRDRN